MGHFIRRLLAYLWAGPNTLLGLAVGLVLVGRFRLVDGVIEIHGPGIRWALGSLPNPAAAMTLGHCVLGRSAAQLRVTRRHERVHVRQFERWGIGFIPAYLGASLWLMLRRAVTGKGDCYRDNPFEVEAFDVDDPGKTLHPGESVRMDPTDPEA